MTRIDWEGKYTLSNVTYDIEHWLIQAMSKKQFTTDNSKGYLVKFTTPYLMSTDEATTKKANAKMKSCVRELPNGQVAYPAILKNILRPMN